MADAEAYRDAALGVERGPSATSTSWSTTWAWISCCRSPAPPSVPTPSSGAAATVHRVFDVNFFPGEAYLVTSPRLDPQARLLGLLRRPHVSLTRAPELCSRGRTSHRSGGARFSR